MSQNTTSQPYKFCTEVTALCPVAATTLGYYPNPGINYFFAIGFGLAMITTFFFGAWKRTWAYSSFITAGCALEMAGYASRIPLHENPWNKNAFETQIVAIILSPTIICISIYLTLKHICMSINPDLSRIKPRLYPWIFVPADISCLLIQAIGGSLAASAGYTNKKLLDGGNHAIIAGIVLQLVVLGFFGVTIVDYLLRVRKWFRAGNATPEALELGNDRKFRMFVFAVGGAYCCILIRCIYRVAEMAGGWGNKVMQDQPSFIVLEGFMILIAVGLLAAFPPGFLFPQITARSARLAQRKKEAEKRNGSNEMAVRSSGESPSATTEAKPTV